MVDSVYSPCPGDVQAFVPLNRQKPNKREGFNRVSRKSREGDNMQNLFKFLMVSLRVLQPKNYPLNLVSK